MLVLSRRVDQEIVFPNTGITLKLLQVRGQVIKVGIDAPESVRILRKEACTDEDLRELSNVPMAPMNRHQVRNRLNAINLAVHLFQKQIAAGLHDSAQITFHRLTSEFANLDAIFGTPAESNKREIVAPSEKRLLVVDDDLNEREILMEILQHHGFQVTGACDGHEALDVLFSIPEIDCVLLDIRMPHCDGLEVLHKIREHERLSSLKVFAMSGVTDYDRAQQVRPGGFDAWFAKPLDPDNLIAAVTNVRPTGTLSV